MSVKMAAVFRILISCCLMLHIARAEKSSDHSIQAWFQMLLRVSPQSCISLLLLGLTVVMFSGFYLWILRYILIGCCQPITVSPESESLAGLV